MNDPQDKFVNRVELALRTTKNNENLHNLEAATQMCSLKKVFWKYAANFLENTHAKVWFQ